MSRATRSLPERADLEQYKKQAKELVQAHGASRPEAAERVIAFLPRAAGSSIEAVLAQRLKLSEAQLVLARELGFASWAKLKQGIELLAAERGNQVAQIEAFKSAIELGDPEELRRLLARYPSLKAQVDAPLFAFGAPAIVRAKRDRELVSALLELGADVNARSQWAQGSFGVLDENTPEMAEFLVQRGARLDIHSAAQLGKLGAVKEFLAAAPELAQARGPDGKLPLHVASAPEIVDCLLDHGADLEARDLDHVATAAEYQIKNLPVLRRLIERGARCDAFMAAALGDIALLERVLGKDPSMLHGHAPTMVGETSEESGYYYPPPPENSAHIYTWSLGFGWSVPYTARELGHTEAYEFSLRQLPRVDRLAEASKD